MAKNDTLDGLGLGKLGGISLSGLMEPAAEKYREIDLDLIREDGLNPRETFDPETLEELAATIRVRGVITPISVRPDPERADGFVVNHGHRRLRAARLAGRATIPAVLDESFQDEDRIIENIQRDNLGMFEVARYIAGKLADGLKQKEVAARIGKSAAYVNNHVQLLELPPHTAEAVKVGRVTDLTAINELAKAEKKYPAETELFLRIGDGEITRAAAQAFRATLAEGGALRQSPGGGRGTGQESSSATDKNRAPRFNPAYGPDQTVLTTGWRRGRVLVTHAGRKGALLLEREPSDAKHVWVRYDGGGEAEAPVAGVKIRAVVAG